MPRTPESIRSRFFYRSLYGRKHLSYAPPVVAPVTRCEEDGECDGASGGESSKLSCGTGVEKWAAKERVKRRLRMKMVLMMIGIFVDRNDEFYSFDDV
ncbi:hypothetical protein Tco_0588580 [Tanacetum coccineum]